MGYLYYLAVRNWGYWQCSQCRGYPWALTAVLVRGVKVWALDSRIHIVHVLGTHEALIRV